MICHIQLPVDQLEMNRTGQIQPGRYVLPFEFQLPNFLPSTMGITYNGGYARIQYKLKAELEGSGVMWNHKCESPISVRSIASVGQMVPYEGPPSIRPVNMCCCINRGTMALGARMETTALAKGQAAAISFSCRNHSSVDVRYVQATMKQRVQWKAGTHSDCRSDVLQSVNFSSAGMGAKAKEEVKYSGKSREADSVREERETMLRSLREYKNCQQLILPLSSLSTYSGSLIKVSHEVKLWVETPGCVDSPELRIPILACDIVMQSTSSATISQISTPQNQPIHPSAPPCDEDSIFLQNHLAPTTAPPAMAPIPFESSEDGHGNFGGEQGIVYAQPIRVDTTHAVFGGDILSGSNEGDIDVPPMAAAQVDTAVVPSVDSLLKEMGVSVAGDVDTVTRYVNDPTWTNVFAQMNPSQYAAVVAKVQSAFDETYVAVVLAKALSSSNIFTCQHAAAAVRMASDFNRTNMVEKLLPYCHDLQQNHKIIQAALTDWEQSVAQHAFDEALSGGA